MSDETQATEKLPEETTAADVTPEVKTEETGEVPAVPAIEETPKIEDVQPAAEETKPEEPVVPEETTAAASNDCAACSGTGLQDERTLCPNCQGKGKVS